MASGCLSEAPSTEDTAWDESCRGTAAGNACLSLHIYVLDELRENAPGDLRGVLNWAVYKGGDVGLFGPGDSPTVFDGDSVDPVDLAPSGSAFDVHIPDVPPGSYQVLAYLNDDGIGEDSSGDPVTFPSEPFAAKPNLRSRVNVVLDYLR